MEKNDTNVLMVLTLVFYCLVTRTELYVILCFDQVYNVDRIGTVIMPSLNYEEVSVDYIAKPAAAMERVRLYAKVPHYCNIFINLVSIVLLLCVCVSVCVYV
jgi:hypothetical protein